MDISWIDLRPGDPAYYDGCKKFVELAKETHIEGKTRCPCNKCKLNKWFSVDDVGGHILFNGFYRKYRNWIFHLSSEESNRVNTLPDQSNVTSRDDMEGLLKAAFMVDNPHLSFDPTDVSFDEPYSKEDGSHDMHEDIDFPHENDDNDNGELPYQNTKEEDIKYIRLKEASVEALYRDCTTFSKLSFLLHLFHLKCLYHWSAESFTKLLELLLDAFPQIKEFPSSYYEGVKLINDLGLGYQKIHACPNNCMLYWGEFAEKDKCHICHASRWKTVKGKEGDTSDKGKESCKKGEAAKVMRYFPLIPRLKRLYMSSKTAEDMRWHKEDPDRLNADNDFLRHPADALAWKEFDKRYPVFAADPRSVRLGLACDGFNPYRVMSTNYSTWPVVLIPYNLPPWLCMKPTSFILSLIIPGKFGPGSSINVYLQPLIHELKLLWKGVDAFDAYSGQTFKMQAALHSTINDFPAYAMLSGWSTKGFKACPICTNSTHSYRFGGKICYPCHRKWLQQDHPYRFQAELFDGEVEYGSAPDRPTGTEILRQQEGIEYVYGKSKKRGRRQVEPSLNDLDDDHGEGNNKMVLWSTKSIFFELEYWEHNLLRHNLDVMHIEKNVCDNVLGTLLDMEKSRDSAEARRDLKKANIKPHLWLQPHPSREFFMPPASFTMTTEEKERFLRVLQKLRVPDGYGSNLNRCVNMKQRKLINMKSHDNHILMQDILPVALRASNATKIIDLLEELSTFFKKICSPTISIHELDEIESKVVLTLCKMEMEFLPTFFTIMVHLLIHLVEEVRLGGPVHYRWMYPIERYMAFLKSHVSNKAQPEGSIAEGYLLWETITFCSRYLEGVETLFNRPKRNEDGVQNINTYLYSSGVREVGKKENIRLDDKSLRQAHRYVLLHMEEITPVITEFIRQKCEDNQLAISEVNETTENGWIINEFEEWLRNQVHNLDDTSDAGKLRKALAIGLSKRGKRMKSVFINGYKFDTMDRERHRKTQNSGIMVEADGQEYYGKLKVIYELNYYYGSYKVVLFHCDWVDIRKGLKRNTNGGVCVNFCKLMHTGRNLSDDPFIFSSQAKQVFYVEDEIRDGWLHVIKTKPRDLFD